MATLHAALQTLGPIAFADVPSEHDGLHDFLKAQFAQAQLITESVPPPPTPSKAELNRPRPATVSSALDLVQSAAWSEALPEHASLQKEWGKPLKLQAKENPLGMAVYKLAAKDGRGAWFARRSTLEGLSFDRWKEALIREFPESLKVQGAPGEGNVRGIGGETHLERVEKEGVGCMEVYRLSAQFPGPTTPRDFVTLLLTSSDALHSDENQPYVTAAPRHLMIISKPCNHPDAQPQNGFIRGSYESVEIIREIPQRKRHASVNDLHIRTNSGIAREAMRRAQAKSTSPEKVSDARSTASPPGSPTTRARGSTLSFAESRGATAKGEAMDLPRDECAPVEWIMVTRSDPGGSVPRFMVERGTPSSIVGDAKKFLDWACSNDFTTENGHRRSSTGLQREANLAGLPGQGSQDHAPRKLSSSSEEEAPAQPQESQKSILDIAQAAYAGLESYAAQTFGARATQSPPPEPAEPVVSSNSGSSANSFASAEDYMSDGISSKSKTSSKFQTAEEKELAKLESRKAKLAEKLQKTKDKQVKDRAQMTEREAERARKADEKHAREVAKAEERHERELRNLEARRRKEERKLIERQERDARRERERVQKDEREELRKKVQALIAERDLLQETCKRLQAENTRLVAAAGKLPGGEDALKELGVEGKLEDAA